MADNAIKPLDLAVGIFLTLLATSIGFFILRGSRGIATAVTEKVDSASITIGEADLMRYNNAEVKGSDVVACIRSNGDKVLVGVGKIIQADGTMSNFTVSDVAGADVTLDNFNNLPNNSMRYINPNADFIGTVSRNANGVITQVNFRQKEYVDDASFFLASGTYIPSGGSSGDDASLLGGLLADMSISLGNMAGTIESLSEDMSTVQGDLHELKNSGSNGGGLSAQLDTLEGKFEDVSRVIGSLSDSLSMLQDSINGDDNANTITNQIAALNSVLSELQSTIGSFSSGDEGANGSMADTIHSMQETIASMGGVLDALTKVIGELPEIGEGDNSSTVLETIQNLTSVIESMQGSIDEMSKTLDKLQENMKDPGGSEGGGSTETGIPEITMPAF